MNLKDPYMPVQPDESQDLFAQVKRGKVLAQLRLAPGWDLVTEWLSKKHDSLVNELMTALTSEQLRMLQGGIRCIKEFQQWFSTAIDKGEKAEVTLQEKSKTRLL